MKRLSVRLSIVGAVLALGGAAIAYSLLSKQGDASSTSDEQSVATAPPPAPVAPTPIRTEGDQPPQPSRTLQPPPTSAFERSNSLRTVSHEFVPPAEDAGNSEATTVSADMIPAADPADASSPSNASFPLPSPSYGWGGGSPADESGGASAETASPTSDGPMPPVPTYAAGAAAYEEELTAADSLSNNRASATTGGMAPPASGVLAGTSAGEGPASGGGSSTLQPPSSGFSTAAAGGNVSVPTSTVRAGSTFGLADAPANTARASAATGLATGAAVGATAAGRAASQLGTPSDSATIPERSAFDVGGPLAGVTAPSPSSYSTRSTNPVASGASTNGLGASYPYGETSPTGPDREAPGAAAPSYPSTDSSTQVSTPYGASSGVANAVAAAGSTSFLASDVPGDRQLEGQQTPAILIEKLAPEEIQVDRTATFQVRVRNAGNAVAYNVVVVDRVPRGTRFIDAVPPAAPTADGTLVWQLESVKPGEEVILSMNLMPKIAGEIGSVAQATFQAQASVRTICTQPELKLDVTFPPEILIGQPATLEITVTNTGTGAAEKVVIEEDVPDGFTHAAGRQLEHEIGILRPQESRRLTLVLDTVEPGSYENHLSVRGEGNLFVEDVRTIEITSPQLQIAMRGPTLRYLDRPATYAVHLSNPGTAPARNVELVTYLPKGMKYVTSDNQGQYDSQSHAVYWSLEELPADKQGDVHVTVLPIEPGNHKLKTDGRADLGLKQACEHEVAVEGLAELAFTVSDVADPIEEGSDTAYEIRVHNKGSKPDTDVQVVAELPTGMTPSTGDGPTQGIVQGQRVHFSPLARLGPNEEAVFKIHARGMVTGDHVIRVAVRSTELRVPVTKEEITRVYSDR